MPGICYNVPATRRIGERACEPLRIRIERTIAPRSAVVTAVGKWSQGLFFCALTDIPTSTSVRYVYRHRVASEGWVHRHSITKSSRAIFRDATAYVGSSLAWIASGEILLGWWRKLPTQQAPIVVFPSQVDEHYLPHLHLHL